jgi:hypothetical protein
MSLKGKRELNARLKALRTVFKPIGKAWGKSAVAESRSRIPVKTGKLKRSVRVTSATQIRQRAAEEALRKNPMAAEVIAAWNRAA